MIPLTLNMMALIIENDAPKKAQDILSILETIELTEKNSYERMTQQWGIHIAQYYLTKDQHHLNEAKKVVNIFSQIGMKDTYHLYNSWTNSYQKIIPL